MPLIFTTLNYAQENIKKHIKILFDTLHYVYGVKSNLFLANVCRLFWCWNIEKWQI